MNNPFGKPVAEEDFEVNVGEMEDSYPPPGEYVSKVVDIMKTTSKQNNPMWEWTFVITEGKWAGTDRKLWTVTTPSALWKLNETLRALGFESEDGTVKFKKADAINRGCVLVLEESEYNGKKNASVARVLPHPKGAGHKLGK